MRHRLPVRRRSRTGSDALRASLRSLVWRSRPGISRRARLLSSELSVPVAADSGGRRRCDYFPQIPVGIAEVPEVPAPFGGSSRLDDLSSSARRPAQNLIDFLGGRDDVAQREPAKPGALGGHASVLGEPLPRVERESLDEPSPRSRATKLPSSHWIVHPRST